ncbi:MAG: AMP-binding protein [Deltaproteobacteria bacterium]|nr:AMP-binding protein [Deltaproteobacteria bacterium]MBW2075347.1 AMP-binding protein [Deltaproteobacteria bacterium]
MNRTKRNTQEKGQERKLDTLPKILRYRYEQNPNGEVLREKDRGIWRCYTWKDYFNNVKYLSLGLVSLGFKRGDKIAILGENKPEWYYAELAAQAAGGTAVGIFSDCVPSEVKFYLRHSDSVFVVAHDQEQVDKLLEIKDEIPLVEKVIFWDPKGLWGYEDSMLISLDDVLELGREYERSNPEYFDQSIDQGSGDDICVICYTSGTTGEPKGAMFSQRYMVEGVTAWIERDNWMGHGYNYLSFIPPAWGMEQSMGIAGSLLSDIVVNFPERPETVQENLREIGPELLFYGARLWEMVNRTVQAKMFDSTLPRRFMYRMCLPIGLKVSRLRSKKINIFWRTIYSLTRFLFFRQLLDNLGLNKAKIVYSAGAAVSPEIIHFFQALGVEIKMLYGTTETGLVSIPIEGDIRPETCGPILPWVEVKFSDEGEILVKSKYMYSGYYKNSEATEEKMKDGYYQTGDFGHMDEKGHLIVIDRMEDLKSLAGGKKFSPQYTEIRLRFSPYIKDTLVIGGEKRDYVTTLINIDVDNVGQFAEKNSIPYTTLVDLSQKPEVIDLVRQEVAKVNRTLPDYARIKRFANLHKDFDADEAELTRTRKLRRAFVEESYSELIEALYDEMDEYEVQTPITYRDGRTGFIKTFIRLNNVEVKQR